MQRRSNAVVVLHPIPHSMLCIPTRSSTVAQSLAPELIASIVGGYNSDPFAVLGPHMTTLDAAPAVAVRTFLPWADHVQVARDDGPLHDMERIHPERFFEAIVPSDRVFGYTLRATNHQGHATDLLDPYSFGPLLTDFDLHLIG